MSVALEPFKRAIVRIMDNEGRVHGMGLLISSRRVLTCAHVATQVLEDGDTTKRPAATLEIDAPFADRKRVSACRLATAGRRSSTQSSDPDLAVLELASTLAVDGDVHLCPALSLSGLTFKTWVAQAGHEHDLIPVSGKVNDEIANGRYMLDVSESNYKIRPGCSGAPVIDPTSGLILGLIVAQELDTAAQSGFLLPAVQLQRLLQETRVLPEEEPGLERLRSWAEKRYRSRALQRADVLRFIESYRGRPDEPQPFVGRAGVLHQLDLWLFQKEQRFRLLSGPAGRGKSALVLHWLSRVIQLDRKIAIFYLPISIRFSMADELSGVQILFAALCDVFSEIKDNFPQQPQVEDYLDRIASAWSHIASRPEHQFLLIIDGLDEAIHQWPLERRVLPHELPSNLHVLISARHKHGHNDGAAWLDDLGCQLIGIARAEAMRLNPVLELTTLDRPAMAEAVSQLGHPIDQLAERQAFIETLYRLTDAGDPLLLRLWLGQIWRYRDRAPDLDADALAKLRPSFGGFYERWMKDQQSVWKAQRLKIHPEDFGHVMQVLAVAQGPMLLSDIHAVLCHLNRAVQWKYEDLRDAIESAHRLVVGDGQRYGYALLHPRLAEYFKNELDQSPAQLQRVRRAFRAWGANTVLQLNYGELSHDQCPHYLLNHYVTVHIAANEAVTAECVHRYFLPLLRQGWPMAWLAYEGSWQGYSHDLQRVVQALHAFNQDCVQRSRPGELRLAAQVRCALLAATIRSQSHNLSEDLVVSLTREGIWSIARAARVAMLFAPICQATCLSKIAAIAAQRGASAEARSLLQHALEAAAAIREEWVRADTLSTLATQLRGDSVLLQQAQQAALRIQCTSRRAQVLIATTAQLPGASKHESLHQLLRSAAAIQDERARAQALRAVATQLRGHSALLHEALQAAIAIPGEESRSDALCGVARQLQGEGAMLQQALQAAIQIPFEWYRAHALSAVASQLQGERALLQQVLQAVTAIKDEKARVHVLSAVAVQLRGERALLQQALQTATAIRKQSCRAMALSAIATHLQGDSKREVLRQALQGAQTINDLIPRAEALSAVAAHLQGECRRLALHLALQAAAAIEHRYLRVLLLGKVAAQLQGQGVLLHQALQVSAVIQDDEARSQALSTVAAYLQGDLKHQVLQQALQAALAIQGKESHRQLCAVIKQLDGERELLHQALQLAVVIPDEWWRTETLCQVVTRLQGGNTRLDQALQIAAVTRDDASRSKILCAVANQLSGQSILVNQALQIAAAIGEEYWRIKASSALAINLSGKSKRAVLHQALQVAAAMQRDVSRAEALRALVAHLQAEGALLHRAVKMAVHAAGAIQNEWSRVDALSEMAVYLQGEPKRKVLRQALRAAAATPSGPHPLALSAVVTKLQGERALIREALQVVRVIQNEQSRARGLSEMSVYLQGRSKQKVLHQALQTAIAIQDEVSRAQTLSKVVTRLRGERLLLREALQAALAIENELQREHVLIAVVAQLHGETALLQQALQAGLAIQGDWSRRQILEAVATQAQHSELQITCVEAALALSEEQSERITISAIVARQNPALLTYELWHNWLTHTQLKRRELLKVIEELAHCAVQLTGRTEEAEEIAEAIIDVCQWWP